MARRLAEAASRAALIIIAASACATLAASCGGSAATPDAALDTHAPTDTAASDPPADAIDCRASCDRIAAICEGMSNIDENWLSICRQNCGVRLAVMPETALAEVTCVAAATDCTTAILCSVSPPSGG